MALQNTELNRQRKELVSKIIANRYYGKRIYLIGSAEFGPTNEPRLIRSAVGLHNTFGKSGSLIKAFHQLKYTIKDNLVYLVKTTGEHATARLNINQVDDEILTDAFIISSSESNEVFNDVTILPEESALTIVYPKSCGDYRTVFSYKDYPTMERLCEAINKSTKSHKGFIFVYFMGELTTPTADAFHTCNPSIVSLYGGFSGTCCTKNMLYNSLERTYSLLESSDIDIIVPIDAFLDDVYPYDANDQHFEYGMKYYQETKDYLTDNMMGQPLSYMSQLIDFCIKQNNFGLVTTGVIGYNPMYEYTEYLYDADRMGQMLIDCFKYNQAICKNLGYAYLVNVVAGDLYYNNGLYYDNAYLAFAGFAAATRIISGITNIALSDNITLYHEFTEPVLEQLRNTGINVFRQSPLFESPVIYDAVTASYKNTELKCYVNVRMINVAMSHINELFQFYIGLNMYELMKENIIVTDLKNLLSTLKNSGVITSSDFIIVPYYHRGEIKVYFTLETIYTVKSVKVCSVIDLEFAEEE